jgi:hypothetical protein
MNTRKFWTFLLTSILPVQFASAQFVDLQAEIQVSDWHTKDLNTWTTQIHCLVGTNSWQMDGDFSRNAKLTYWFTGTNIIEESVITKDVSDIFKDFNRPGLPHMSAPAIGTTNTRVTDCVDGNPGQTVRRLDHMTMVARIGWLAFCSGPCLKREGRQIFPPSDLWKELVRTDQFTDRTVTFQDALGLPERTDLYTTNGQIVAQYRVTSSTNVLGWQFPLAFELVQYRPAPVPGLPYVTAGTNGWELQFIAKGKVAAMKIGTAPHLQ